jgi:alkylation response protein AidB-like acyl-CoA dehydrogenase
MNIEYSEEQQMLAETTRALLDRGRDSRRLSSVSDPALGWSREVWDWLAKAGILGLGFDSDIAGHGEIAAVGTEFGRALAPEPVVAAALIPGVLIAEAGRLSQRGILDDVEAGRTLLAFAHGEPGMRHPLSAIATQATKRGESWFVNGRKGIVLAGDCADLLVVSAMVPDGHVGLFLVDSTQVARRSFRTFDGRRGTEVDFESVIAEPLGEIGDAQPHIERTVIRHLSLLCAEAVGAMEEAVRLTSSYLATRKQFGVTLRTFQALTHRAADMYVSAELAKSMSLYASASIAEGTFDSVIAARAKLQIGRAATHIGQESIQLHGGIGMTAEYTIGRYAARLSAIEQTLGSSSDHLNVLVQQIERYDTVSL